MSSIAATFGTTVKKLSAYNGIKDPSLIHPGQILRIP
jgi:LysM repeat protein